MGFFDLCSFERKEKVGKTTRYIKKITGYLGDTGLLYDGQIRFVETRISNSGLKEYSARVVEKGCCDIFFHPYGLNSG